MTKSNKMMIVAAVLLCMTLVSIHITSGLYAKYTVSEDASDNAKVAQFHIETDLDYITMGLGDNETPLFELGGTSATEKAEILFYIESRSEVAASYSVTAAFGTALPNYVTLTLSDGIKSETVVADGTKATFEFQEFGSIAAFEGSDEEHALRTDLVLTIGVTAMELITEEIELPAATLSVQVDQID